MVEVERLPYTLSLVSAPAAEPLDATEVKLNSRIDHSAEDILISHLINCARVYVENVSGRALVTQTWKAFYDEWPSCGGLILPKAPVASITHVKYYDTTGTPATWASTNYILDGDSNPPRLVLSYSASWPSATLQPIKGVEVQLVGGYGNAVAVPSAYKQAMYLLCEHWYVNRSEVTIGNTAASVSRRIELGVEALLAQYKIH